jgi:hypothetical protein
MKNNKNDLKIKKKKKELPNKKFKALPDKVGS